MRKLKRVFIIFSTLLISGCGHIISDAMKKTGADDAIHDALWPVVRPLAGSSEGHFDLWEGEATIKYTKAPRSEDNPSLRKEWLSRVKAAIDSCKYVKNQSGDPMFSSSYCTRIAKFVRNKAILKDIYTRTIHLSTSEGVEMGNKILMNRLLKKIERHTADFRVQENISKRHVRALFKCLPISSSKGESILLYKENECLGEKE